MKALNQMEKWTRNGLPEYRAQLQVFQNANDRLIRTAPGSFGRPFERLRARFRRIISGSLHAGE